MAIKVHSSFNSLTPTGALQPFSLEDVFNAAVFEMKACEDHISSLEKNKSQYKAKDYKTTLDIASNDLRKFRDVFKALTAIEDKGAKRILLDVRENIWTQLLDRAPGL